MRCIHLGAPLLAMALFLPDPSIAGSIAGHISDQASAADLDNIDLDLFDSLGNVVAGADADTNAAGDYVFANLPNGNYKVKADPPNPPDSFYVDEFWGGGVNQNAYVLSQSVNVQVNGAETGIDFKLEQGGAISGRITGDAAAPLASVDLDLYDATRTKLVFSTTTDAAGNYAFKPFPTGQSASGTFFVKADPSKTTSFYVDRFYNAQTDLAAANPVTVNRLQTTANINFSLIRGGRISGTVALQSPQPGDSAADIDLDLFDAVTGAFFPAYDSQTDATGAYVLGAVPPGTYKIKADPNTPTYLVQQFYSGQPNLAGGTVLNVGAGTITPNVNFTLVKGGLLTGHVRTQGTTAVPGIDLDLFDSATGTFISAYDATSDATGSYSLGPVPAGSYFIRADAAPLQAFVDQYFSGGDFEAQATAVTVSIGATRANIDFDLKSGSLIHGIVTVAGTPGTPVVGLDLDVYTVDGNELLYESQNSGVDGSFNVGPLPAGTYLLRADPVIPGEYYNQFYSTGLDAAGATAITVGGAGATANLALQKGHLLSGHITDALSGAFLQGIGVEVYNSSGGLLALPARVSDVNGRFSIGPVTPGTVFLRAVPPGGDLHTGKFYLDSPTLGGATAIQVAQTNISGLDFALSKPGDPPTPTPTNGPGPSVGAGSHWSGSLLLICAFALALPRLLRRRPGTTLLVCALAAALLEDAPSQAKTQPGTTLSFEGRLLGSYLSSLDQVQPEGEVSLLLENRSGSELKLTAALQLSHDRQQLKLFNFDPAKTGSARLFTTVTGVALDLGLKRRFTGGSDLQFGLRAGYRDGADPGDDQWSASLDAAWTLQAGSDVRLKTSYGASLIRYPDYLVAERRLDSLRQEASLELELRPSEVVRARIIGTLSPKHYLDSKYFEFSPQGENRNLVRSAKDRLYLTESAALELELRPVQAARIQFGFERGVNDAFNDNRLVLRKRFVRDYFDHRFDRASISLRAPLPGRCTAKASSSLEWRDFTHYPARDGEGGLLDALRSDREFALRLEFASPPLGLGNGYKLRGLTGLIRRASRSNSKDAGIDETDFLVNYDFTQIYSGIAFER